MEYLKKRQTSSALFCCYVIEISTGRYIAFSKKNSSPNLTFRKRRKEKKNRYMYFVYDTTSDDIRWSASLSAGLLLLLNLLYLDRISL